MHLRAIYPAEVVFRDFGVAMFGQPTAGKLASVAFLSTALVAVALPVTASSVALETKIIAVAFAFVLCAGIAWRAWGIGPALAETVAGGGERPISARTTALLFAMILAAFTASLLAFWPGMMTQDSLNQWSGILQGRVSEIYSFGHSLLVGAVHLAGLPPVGAVIVQMVLLAFAAVVVLRELSRWGVPTAALFVGALAFAIWPANIMFAVTLWKDVPYSAGVVLCLAAALAFVRMGGRPVGHGFWAILVAGIALVLFMRLNGLLVFLLPVTMALFAQSRRWALMGLGATCAAIFVLVKFVAAPMLGFGGLGPQYVGIVPIHIIAAHLNHGAELSPETTTMLQSILPLEEWRSKYYCENVGALFFHPQVSWSDMGAHGKELLWLAVTLSVRDPITFLAHQLCVSEMLWQVMPWDAAWLAITPEQSVAAVGTVPPELQTKSAWPGMQSLLLDVRTSTATPQWIWLYWRPAGYLLVTVIVCLSLAIAARDARFFVPAAMPLINTLSLIPTIGSPDFRYQHGVMMSALFLLLLLAARSRVTAGHSVTNVTRE